MTDTALVRDLTSLLGPERVLARPLDLVARSVDASIYRVIPRVVVRPRTTDEVAALCAYARAHRRHLTFRTAGTSLSGQALSDDILVELAPFWKESRILDDGARVWTQPGVIGGYLNLRLARHGVRIGPDPASIDSAMMGGILANNSSGMCCGVVQNSYHTLDSIALMLADGTRVDTAQPDADEALQRQRPDLHRALLELRDAVRADAALADLIRRKFVRKQTTGYSLNALLDHDAPAQILAHLMVGSEGTLGFVSGFTLRTVPDPPARATALLFFARLEEAGAAVGPLAAAGAAALEIMDAASLRSQAGERADPFAIGDDTAALLAEFREADAPSLDAAVRRAESALASVPLLAPAAFTRDAQERDRHWRLRKGLFPSVGGMRPSGTAVVIEDVVVPVERLAEAIAALRALFAQHGFEDAIVFGHARDGNLHFVFARDFGDGEAVRRYADFMQGLVELIVGRFGGALKAEHGSGRNMAPFVRDEWGDAAYAAMRKVKELLDPDGILNPGVVLTDDPFLHLRNLKPLPAISPLADRCMECGFCEPRCPSRDVTLSPRQRITVHRELARLAALGTPEARHLRDALLADYEYEGIATCVGDSMCQTSCPVKIDTSELMKEMRAAGHPRWAESLARAMARNYGLVARAARLSLGLVARVRGIPGGGRFVQALSTPLNRMAPSLVPRLDAGTELPRAAAPLASLPPATAETEAGPAARSPAGAGGERPRVVYYPSCLTRILGPLPGEDAVPTARAMHEVLAAAGFAVAHPEDVGTLCCGMPFASKAFFAAAGEAGRRAVDALWAASRAGRDPVVTDASPCAGTLCDAAAAQHPSLRILDFPTFWAREGLPRVGGAAAPRRKGLAILHPTCTLVKRGGMPDLLAVARAHSEEVAIPAGAECCGFAGDRGFLVPEVTASATVREAADVRGTLSAAAGEAPPGLFSTCRTCEIGMRRAVGVPYRSLVHLVHDAVTGG